jgi:hypothetical protein
MTLGLRRRISDTLRIAQLPWTLGGRRAFADGETAALELEVLLSEPRKGS